MVKILILGLLKTDNVTKKWDSKWNTIYLDDF